MTRRFEGAGPTGGRPGLENFERWKAKQAEKGKTSPTADNQLYRDFVSAMRGETAERMAGVAEPQVAGGRDVRGEDLGDDQFYAAFQDEISGAAGRRRSEAKARRAESDRKAKALADAKLFGLPLRQEDEDLRRELRDHGYYSDDRNN